MTATHGVLALFLAASAPAQAFTLESPIGKPCHERITSEALRRVRARLGLTATPLARDEQLLLEGLPFNPERDMRDLEGVSLLIAVRDPDLKGLDPTDLQRLASVHGHGEGQREHCLRRATHDGPEGTQAALTECRAFIFETATYASEQGLTAESVPDMEVRTRVAVFLTASGPSRPLLPLFWVYAGQALHALQDSFTHAYRDPETARVDAVMNWVDFANDDFDERRDGPAHESALDQCDGSPEADLRRERATDASEALLMAMLSSAAPEARANAVGGLLDTVLASKASCTADNRWCDAERPAPGCSVTGAGAGFGALALVLARLRRRAARLAVLGQQVSSTAAGVLAASRLHRSAAIAARAQRLSGAAAGRLARLALMVLCAVVALPSLAAAEPIACVPGQQISCACTGAAVGTQRCVAGGASYDACTCPMEIRAALNDSQEMLRPTRFGVYVSTGVSIDQTAFVANLAARYHLNDVWLVGVGVEWNPWFSIPTRRMQAGTIDLYASVIKRWPITERAAARTTAHLGASALLFNLYGAPAGNIGLYAAFSFIGLEVRLSRNVLLVIDPCEVAMPVPHLTGVPITYRQYRFAFGFQFGA